MEQKAKLNLINIYILYFSPKQSEKADPPNIEWLSNEIYTSLFKLLMSEIYGV